ncbi:copper amine oxidase N-terminal domain-containing protein [Paenibacillus macerans]|uniref:copper amine oxidase N-terminal domain-containing protein n=1 Tax=Paenibacillus macerans TaxID=44252 RepID=UPI00203DD06C|nr:copper amine oxidase N-terminal domain-containing protein [Paenibacillus macerans]MCM3699293.1 copper amine oxidase N-terminal domain-containing protein [Paenibacillus macerans]
MILRKRVVLIMISVTMALGFSVSAAAAAKVNVTVQVDGKTISFPDAQPYYEDNRVMIPLRFVSEALGADVGFKKTASGAIVNQTVITSLGDKKMSMNINSKQVVVGETVVTLDVPARLQQERTYVPLRFVSEALGAKVDWNQSKKLVSISTGKEVTDPDPVPDGNNVYSSDFTWNEGYTKLAKALFADNMKVANGKLTFTLPKEATAVYSTAKGAKTSLTPGKTYTYPIGEGQGSISISQDYPGSDKQEGYVVFLNSKENGDLEELFGQYDDAIVIVGGNSSGAPLSEVQKLAQELK